MFMALLLKENSPTMLVYTFAPFSGIWSTVCSLVPFSILPDLADVDELITGKRREGVYAGMATFMRKLGNGITVGIAGLMLQIFGYNAIATVQTTQALVGIQ